MRCVPVALSIILALQTGAHASVARFDLNKSNQNTTAALKFSLTQLSTNGMVVLHLAVPRKQAQLDHLWRVDVLVRKGKGTALDVPLETKLVNGDLTAELIVDPSAMKGLEIWIRTGEHAPLAETIYAIDVGSFK